MRRSGRQFRLRLFLLIGVMAIVVFQAPRPAEAIFGFGDATITVSDIPRQISEAISKGISTLNKSIKISADIAFKNSVKLFTSRIVQEAATQLATAGPGQEPLFLQDPRTFFLKAGNSAATDFIDNFSRGVTGRTGPGTNLFGDQPDGRSARARFIITRSLRTALGSPVDQCRQDCREAFAVSNVYEPGFVGPRVQQNSYEQAITLVLSQMNAPGGTVAQAAQASTPTTAAMNCQYILPSANTGAVLQWTITSTQNNSILLAPKDCLAAQRQAMNSARAEAQKAVNQCLKDCQNGVAGVTTKAIQAATARDVFSAVKDVDPSNAPAALANALSKDTSDFGQLVSASSRLVVAVQDRVTGEDTRLRPQVVSRESKVSGVTLTPAEVVTSTFTGLPLNGQSGETTYTGTGAADILKSITSFLNSPVGKYLAQKFKNECGFNPSACKGPSNAKSTVGQLLFGSGGATGIAGAQQQFAQLGQVDFITGDPGRNEISVTDQLTSGGLIDAQFRSAIEEGVTVQQAIDRKLLDVKKTFGFDKNGIQPANGYTYRALQYLRKFRVIPIGWELAARYSEQFDRRDLSLGFLTGQYPMCGNALVCSNDSTKVCTPANASTVCGAAATCGLPEARPSLSVCSNDLTKTCVADTDCSDPSGSNNGTCGASPYCGLVDPNWVLKAPQTYCRRQGAGEEIQTKEFICDQNNIHKDTGDIQDPANLDSSSDNGAPNCIKSINNNKPDIGRWVISRNADTCADVQSCIAENEDGTCIAFGYCVQEKDTFKFDGTQCSEENGTCTTYVDDAGDEATYLANTLDFQNCSADNAGCQWYCREFDVVNGRWTCTEQDRDGSTGKTMNFTESAASCSATQAGCRQFIRTGNGTNLLSNSGFESYTGGTLDGVTTAVFAGWSTIGQINAYPVKPTDVAITSNNGAAVKLTSSVTTSGLSQSFTIGSPLYERTFVGSIRAKADTACTAQLTVSTDVSTITTNIAVTTSWSTFSATNSVGSSSSVTSNSTAVTMTITTNGCGAANLTVDSAQLEEGKLTQYKDYGAVNLVYLNGTRQQCTPLDVGCQKYTPTGRGAAVTGIVRDSNRCSADKVGCGTYSLEPITSLPQRAGGPTNIVPTRAQACSAADVGCEEYTNLNEVARGGEGKSYFKSVKQCVKPDQLNGSNPVQQTYYTWTGDAKRGFVLRAYNLVQSNISQGGGGTAPCTKLSVGTSAVPPTCVDDSASLSAGLCSANDLATNPNCGEYYDANLNVFYRLRSATISVTADCQPFRNTIDAGNNTDLVYYLSPKENVSCRAAAASCRAYTGNAGKTTRQIFTDTFEAGSTTNWVNANSAPSNASVNVGGHSMLISPTQSAPGTAFMPRSVLDGKLTAGKAYTISFLAAAAEDVTPRPRVEVYLGNVSGNTFTYDRNNAGQRFDPLGGVTVNWNSGITPSGPEWNTFTLGPLTHDNITNVSIGFIAVGGPVYVDNIVLTEVNDTLYLVNTSVPICAPSDIGCAAYRDATNATQYLKSFSRVCSEQVVGCEAMIDTQNSTTPFAQTVKNITTPPDAVVTVVNNKNAACGANGKGCEALGLPIYSTDRSITGFKTVYLKNDPDRYSQDLCLAEEVFCRAYTIKGGGAAFFKDPGTGTCDFRKSQSGNGGTWYITGTDIVCPTVTPPATGRPIGASCSPVCQGGERDGRACLANADCAGGSCVGDPANAGKISSGSGAVVGQCTTSDQCTTSAGGQQNTCVYLAGLCPEGQNGCTEYRDPADPVSCRAECPYIQQGASPIYVDASCAPTTCSGGDNAGQNCQTSDQCSGGGSCIGSNGSSTTGFPGCRSYFYLRGSVEDNAGECNGVIDPKTGCRPFNDTSKEGLNFRGE